MSEPDARPAPVEALSFEDALRELEAIVDRLDRGEIALAASVDAYERGTALRQHCERKLDEARLRVERITLGPEGVIGTAPLDEPAA